MGRGLCWGPQRCPPQDSPSAVALQFPSSWHAPGALHGDAPPPRTALQRPVALRPTFLLPVLRLSVALQPSRRHPWGRSVHRQEKAPRLLSAPFQEPLILCPVSLCKATAQRQPRPRSAQLPSSPSHTCGGGGGTQTAEGREGAAGLGELPSLWHSSAFDSGSVGLVRLATLCKTHPCCKPLSYFSPSLGSAVQGKLPHVITVGSRTSLETLGTSQGCPDMQQLM